MVWCGVVHLLTTQEPSAAEPAPKDTDQDNDNTIDEPSQELDEPTAQALQAFTAMLQMLLEPLLLLPVAGGGHAGSSGSRTQRNAAAAAAAHDAVANHALVYKMLTTISRTQVADSEVSLVCPVALFKLPCALCPAATNWVCLVCGIRF